MIQKTQKAINFDDESYWIADSAMYTEDNIKLLGTEKKWITRAPATLEEVDKLLNAEPNFTPGIDSRYAFYAADLNYGGIPQRAVVVWSDEKQKRDEQTFDRKIQKETTQAEKELKKLTSKKFACIPDAENDAKIWASAHPHHILKNLDILQVAEKVEKKAWSTKEG